jgi:hypothetical protein
VSEIYFLTRFDFYTSNLFAVFGVSLSAKPSIVAPFFDAWQVFKINFKLATAYSLAYTCMLSHAGCLFAAPRFVISEALDYSMFSVIFANLKKFLLFTCS